MATIIRAKNGLVPRSRPRSRKVEEIEIFARWLDDQDNNYLLADLPGFKKEEVKIETDHIDKVTISGERQERENNFLYFERNFKVPENSDIGNTRGILVDGILTITVPKRVVPPVKEEPKIPDKEKEPVSPMKEEPKIPDKEKEPVPPVKEEPKIPDKEKEPRKEIQEPLGQKHEDGPTEDKPETREFWRKRKDMLEKQEDDGGLFKVLKHKGIILTAIIAFSLGVLVSRKFGITSRKIRAHKSQL